MTNPLDYTIQDPDAMRYALMANDGASMRKGGAVKMAGGGTMKKIAKGVTKAVMPQAKAVGLAHAPTQYELAHQAAQISAARPIDQGGLGLRLNNTAAERAEAMGLSVDSYHGTTAKSFPEFRSNYAEGQGTGVYSSTHAPDTAEFSEGMGGQTIPLKVSNKLWNEGKDGPPGTVQDTNRFYDDVEYRNKTLKDAGYHGVISPQANGLTGDEILIFDPKHIRSRFAAFDPDHADSSDMLKAQGGAVRMAGGGFAKKVAKSAAKAIEKAIEAPTVMTRSGLSDLSNYVLGREGTYGAQRVERAADEIPNLERLYTQQALADAFSGDNARALMTMKPADFERYAAPIGDSFKLDIYQPEQGRRLQARGEGLLPPITGDEYIKHLAQIKQQGGFSDIPYLNVNKEEQGLPDYPFISGHEGRHRNRAMAASGEQTGLVQFLPRAELREPFPRRSQEQYIDAIRKEMGLSGNFVLPQKYHIPSDTSINDVVVNRPAIQLPDLYKDGGAVHMEDGGDASQADIDRMKFELAQSQFPNSPVMEATPKPFLQNAIGTLGGYMDQTSNFIKDTLAPIAETNPRQHFLANMLLADPLKNAGTALQDYTGTVREADEDNPVRGIISKDWHNLTTSRSPILDPRVLDIAQFAQPVASAATKIAGAGAKAAAPFASKVDDMIRELHASGAMPQPGLSIKDVTPKVLAPANEMGFYSPTEAAALNLQRKSGQGQAFLNDIMKGENVRPDEINAMGLDTLLKGKTNVTADEVRDYIAKNKIQLGESRYGDQIKEDPIKLEKRNEILEEYQPKIAQLRKELNFTPMYVKEGDRTLNNPQYEEIKNRLTNLVNEREIKADAIYVVPERKPTKFQGYQLPGGENYREVVLTLPTEGRGLSEIELDKINRRLVDQGYDGLGEDQRAVAMRGGNEAMDMLQDLEDRVGIRTDDLMKAMAGGDPRTQYRSSHWDEPNVLAHLRMSDRVTDGKKTLLVDEVQSDWHQAGRDQGYKLPPEATAPMDSEYRSLVHKNADAVAQGLTPDPKDVARAKMLEEQLMQSDSSKVPNAPYKEDWYQLALRRAVKEAIDGGYDRVALPTGARVNERFDLSKQIDRIDYNKNPDGTYNMSAIKDGSEVFAKEDLDEKELSGIIGKDVAKKIVGDEGSSAPKADRWEAEDGDVPEFKSLSGLDLQVGGEGNRKYYDEIYPGYLKKFGKKYGASVGKTTVDADGVAEPLHYMDITPAMRESFKTGIHMKKGGKVQFANDLNAMKYELAKAK